jgi:nucleotide-binding universal stress UspA family protein
VTLLHAYEMPIPAYPGAPMLPLIDPSVSAARGAAAGLDAMVQQWRAERGPKLAGVLRVGRPCHEIVAFAKSAAVDLIVMGTHDRKGPLRAILGSVAEKVVRAAPVPVLTVPWHRPEERAVRRAPTAVHA